MNPRDYSPASSNDAVSVAQPHVFLQWHVHDDPIESIQYHEHNAVPIAVARGNKPPQRGPPAEKGVFLLPSKTARFLQEIHQERESFPVLRFHSVWGCSAPQVRNLIRMDTSRFSETCIIHPPASNDR
eukprot:1510100-Amphidinium_carterae.1